VNFGLFSRRSKFFHKGYLVLCRRATKFGRVRGLANWNLFPESCELWSGGSVKLGGDIHQLFTGTLVKWFFDNFLCLPIVLVVSIHCVSWYPVYTIQPVVNPVVQPVWQPAVSCKQTSNRLSNRLEVWQPVRQPCWTNSCSFNTVIKPVVQPGLTTGCIHDTTGCETGWTTGWTTGLTTGCIVYTNIYPVVKPVWQPVWQGCIV